MNYSETLQIMAVLRGAYPAFYRDMSRKEAESVVALWTEMFADDDAVTVAAAVKALISADEKGYPPHIGAVKAKIRQITQPEEMTEGEAWGLVQKAISRGLYSSVEEFDKLPVPVQRLVGSPNQLREWAMMDADTVQSVVASNFQRSYRARIASEREYAKLPPDVKVLVDGISKRMALEGA